MTMLTINDKKLEDSDYNERPTVKSVIYNDSGDFLHHYTNLIGGGVEENETNEQAMHREAMEEAGMKIDIIKPLGTVVGYSEESRRKYIVYGYLCKFVEQISAPTTLDEKELKLNLVWEKPADAVTHFENQIKELQGLSELDKTEVYKDKIKNRAMSLTFIREAIRVLAE